MSRAFTSIAGIAAPLPVANVDTDMLFPAAFLKTVSRKGLGRALFHAQRFAPDGSEKPDFILNSEPWRQAQILVALDNFGCGSSREHAPWALVDFGIRCIIAPSFADIFYGNCFKNGILPIVLPRARVEQLLALTADPQTAGLRVDLQAQTIGLADGTVIGFTVDPRRRALLLAGLDEIGVSLRREREIIDAEAVRIAGQPWLEPDRDITAFVRS